MTYFCTLCWSFLACFLLAGSMEKEPEKENAQPPHDIFFIAGRPLTYYTQLLPADVLLMVWPYLTTPAPEEMTEQGDTRIRARDNRKDYLLEQRKTLTTFKRFIQEVHTNADYPYTLLAREQMSFLTTHPEEKKYLNSTNMVSLSSGMNGVGWYMALLKDLKGHVDHFKELPLVQKQETLLHLIKAYTHGPIINDVQKYTSDTLPKKELLYLIEQMLEHVPATIEDPDSRFTLLRYAVAAEDYPLVDLLLEHRADGNRADKLGVTPLMYAAQKGSRKIIKRLLKNDTLIVNALDGFGFSALMYAVKAGKKKIVKYLLAHGANPCIYDGAKGKNTFTCAVKSRSHSLLKMLLKQKFPHTFLAAQLLNEALKKAARIGNEKAIQTLLSTRYEFHHPAELQPKLDPDAYIHYSTALCEAIRAGNTHIAQILIAYSRDRSNFILVAPARSKALAYAVWQKIEADKSGKASNPFNTLIEELLFDETDPLCTTYCSSPCLIAASAADFNLTGRLLKAAVAQQQEDPASLLFLDAAAVGNVQALCTAIAHGAHGKSVEKETGKTALMKLLPILDDQSYKVLDILLVESDLGAQDALQETIFHKLVKNKNVLIQEKAFEKLIHAGAKPYIDMRNAQGLTPLMALLLDSATVSYTLLEKFLQHGADPNAYTLQGNTPLMYAAERANCELIRILLDHGANPNFQNNSGCGALSKAALVNDINSIELLLSDRNSGLKADFELFKDSMLREAAKGGYADLIETLVDLGASLRGQSSSLGNSPLHKAVQKGNTEAVSLLLKKGASAHDPNFIWQTPLELAVINNDKACAKLLMKDH